VKNRWLSRIIIEEAKDEGYDFNIFVVYSIDDCRAFCKYYGSRYLFVQGGSGSTTVHAAHEVGHGLGLGHVDGEVDTGNLMAELYMGGTRLRKWQWDICNQVEE